MTGSVSIDRTSLSLPALVLAGNGDATTPYVLTQIGRPAITARSTYLPPSPDMHGDVLLNAVKEQTTLPLEVLVQAATVTALDAAVQALADALWQFSYTVTVTPFDGAPAKVWTAGPAAYAPSSGNESVAAWLQCVDVLTLTIPVYPIPGA